MERKRFNQPPSHIPEQKEILPPIGLTVHKEGKQTKYTQEKLNQMELEYLTATHLPHARELGS